MVAEGRSGSAVYCTERGSEKRRRIAVDLSRNQEDPVLKHSLLAALGIAALGVPYLSEPSEASECKVQSNDPIPKEIKVIVQLIKVGANYEKPTSYFDAAKNIYDIYNADPSAYTLYQNLVKELHDDIGYLRDTQIESDADKGLSDLFAAINTASQYIGQKPPQPLPKNTVFEKDTIADVRLAYSNSAMSDILYDKCKRIGANDWTKAVTPLGQDGKPLQDGKPAYDWRFSVPYLMTAIALRLNLIDAEDLNWTSTQTYDQELHYKGVPPGHAEGLEGHWSTIIAGVQCGDKKIDNSDCNVGSCRPSYRYVTCADIYSGLSSSQTVSLQSYPADVAQSKAVLKSKVIEQMPLFDMRAMVDRLHFYVSHAPDLAEARQRIALATNRNLCLEVQRRGVTMYGTPVVLGNCDGTSLQKWVYDRTNHEIYNPRLNKCLEVLRYDLNHVVASNQEIQPTPGTPVYAADCASENGIGAGPCFGLQGDDLNHCQRYQQWTYDPDTQLLSNPFGAVLDVKWGQFVAGQPVWVWERNDTMAQKWYADPVQTSTCGINCLIQ
jgi:hypothetical protein